MVIAVQKRDLTGKKVKQLRAEGLIPASMYGPSSEPVSISVNAKEFGKVFKEAGYSQLVEVDLEGKKINALVKEIQKHPVTDVMYNVSFYQVDMTKSITAEVPIHFTGESPADKNNIGIMVISTDHLTLHCLPKDLPQSLEVNVDGLKEIGSSIIVSDIKLPAGVTLDHGINEETIVVYVAEPQKVEVEPVAEVAAAEGDGAAGDAAKTEEKAS